MHGIRYVGEEFVFVEVKRAIWFGLDMWQAADGLLCPILFD